MAYEIIQILKVQFQMVQIVQIWMISSTFQFYIGETGMYHPDISQHGP